MNVCMKSLKKNPCRNVSSCPLCVVRNVPTHQHTHDETTSCPGLILSYRGVNKFSLRSSTDKDSFVPMPMSSVVSMLDVIQNIAPSAEVVTEKSELRFAASVEEHSFALSLEFNDSKDGRGMTRPRRWLSRPF